MADRNPDGTFAQGHAKTGGRKRRADEEEMLALFDRAFPESKRLAVIRKIVDKALKGNLDCARFLWSYIYGTPVQRQEHTGADGGEITLRVVRDMESGSRIPDPSTNAARQTSGDKGQ